MSGVLEVGTSLSVARAIDDLLLIVECSLDGEWEGQVRYLPLIPGRAPLLALGLSKRQISRSRRSRRCGDD